MKTLRVLGWTGFRAVLLCSILLSGPTARGGGILILPGSIWRYLDDGTDQGTAWREAGFDDSSWPSGPAQLGYGDGDEATVLSFGPDPSDKHITTYFRHAFELPDSNGIDRLVLRILRDDGVAVFLNSVEIYRSNLPAGDPAFDTLASAVAADENSFVEATVSGASLVSGRNVIAAEIHQVNPASSDIGFDLELSAENAPPPAELPEVNVMPVDPFAAEADSDTGVFRFTRSGSVAEPLVISVRYSGTATPGADYPALPGEIGFPAGESSTDLLLEPLNDDLPEGTESVVVTVSRPECLNDSVPSADCYRPGPAGTASISIADDDEETPPTDPATLVATDAFWRYLDDGSDQGSSWSMAEFDDGSWAFGPGPLGYGEGDEGTVVS